MTSKPLTGDRLRKRDIVLAITSGLLFVLLHRVFSVRGLDPALWEDFAVASDLLPPRTIFPAVWRYLSSLIISSMGYAGAEAGLNTLGAVVGGLDVFFVYLLIRQTLAYLNRAKTTPSWPATASFASFAATVCFAVSDPMWNMVSPLTPGGMRFLATVFSLFLFMRYLRRMGVWRAALSMFVAGALAAETPFAFLLPLFCYLAFRCSFAASINGNFSLAVDIEDLPKGYTIPCWSMFFSFLAGLCLGCWANISIFIHFGGDAANGWSAAEVGLQYLIGYYGVMRSASSVIGWIMALTFVILPFCGTILLYPRLCRDNAPMPFKYGVLLFFSAVIAIVQCGILPFQSIWNFSSAQASLKSDYLSALYLLALAATLAMAVSSFMLASRNRYEYDPDDDNLLVAGTRGFLFRSITVVLVIVCAAPSLVRVNRPSEIERRDIVDDALEETVRESGDAKFIFTDGRLDAGLLIKAAQMGSKLKPLSMMSGGSEWERTVRRRHFHEGTPEYDLAETGIPSLLRVWTEESDEGMKDCAVQLGFEIWKRARKPLPKLSGMVARESGLSDDEAARGIAAATNIAARIVAVSAGGRSPSYALENAISSVSWRISRFSRLRDDDALADTLDNCNEPVKHMMRLVEYERARAFLQMTPHEGLRLALYRADFREARRFAVAVLSMDPDDSEANFGTGMAYLMEEKYPKAEEYLKRALVRRPNEPAVLNNLAIIYCKMKKFDLALEYARKAVKLVPGNREVQKTLADIEELFLKENNR
jgi:hypothetical protein